MSIRWSESDYKKYLKNTGRNQEQKKTRKKRKKKNNRHPIRVEWSEIEPGVAKIVIYGRPITKKNHSQIIYNPKIGRKQVVQSEAYRNYEEQCLWLLATYKGPKYLDDAKLHTKILYWMPNRIGWPDLGGLLQGTWDILEKAGVISNDRHVYNADGSRILGIDRDNPRAEIIIRKDDDNEAEAKTETEGI